MKTIEAFLKEIEARADKATPGPWENEDDRLPGLALPWRSTGLIWRKDDEAFKDLICRINPDRLHAASDEQKVAEFEGNAEFIAHARTDVPTLIAMLRKCREQRDAQVVEQIVANNADSELSIPEQLEEANTLKAEYDAELLKLAQGEGKT